MEGLWVLRFFFFSWEGSVAVVAPPLGRNSGISRKKKKENTKRRNGDAKVTRYLNIRHTQAHTPTWRTWPRKAGAGTVNCVYILLLLQNFLGSLRCTAFPSHFPPRLLTFPPLEVAGKCHQTLAIIHNTRAGLDVEIIKEIPESQNQGPFLELLLLLAIMSWVENPNKSHKNRTINYVPGILNTFQGGSLSDLRY